jgi:hypothetical protein
MVAACPQRLGRGCQDGSGRSRRAEVDGLEGAGLLVGDDGAPSLRLLADNQVSLWGRRRIGPGGLSSTMCQQAPQGRAPMKERS